MLLFIFCKKILEVNKALNAAVRVRRRDSNSKPTFEGFGIGIYMFISYTRFCTCTNEDSL